MTEACRGGGNEQVEVLTISGSPSREDALVSCKEESWLENEWTSPIVGLQGQRRVRLSSLQPRIWRGHCRHLGVGGNKCWEWCGGIGARGSAF